MSPSFSFRGQSSSVLSLYCWWYLWVFHQHVNHLKKIDKLFSCVKDLFMKGASFCLMPLGPSMKVWIISREGHNCVWPVRCCIWPFLLILPPFLFHCRQILQSFLISQMHVRFIVQNKFLRDFQSFNFIFSDWKPEDSTTFCTIF
jgi:hypothetical protein